MKRVMNLSIVYFILAMVSGVFYREFTKSNEFMGHTTLSVLHTHILVLGTAVFLFIALLFKLTTLEENTLYKKFYILYNISFPLLIIMMGVRGSLQVLGTTVSKGLNSMISGISGISHIGITIAFLMLLIAIKKELVKE